MEIDFEMEVQKVVVAINQKFHVKKRQKDMARRPLTLFMRRINDKLNDEVSLSL